MAPSAPLDSFPRPFGRYTLLANLAQGGMGALYLACQGEPGMEKLCVIKTVLPHLADKEYVARFRDEAKVVVRLSHGNLVPVFDAGLAKEGGSEELYLAMDYVDGKDLRAVWNQCAKRGIAFPVDVAAYLARELLRGLHHAHTFGAIKLVHRDVSPPNILLSYFGEVKLTDFGLASSTMKTEKTAPGVIYGKVSYMSPEQARGEPLDGRTDLYAVAVILWELLTGRQLFPSQEPNLINRVRDPEVVVPSSHASRVPPQLDAIVMKALAKDRTLRYADAEAFRAALAGFLAQTAPTTDNDRVAKFLAELFGDEIAKERQARQKLLDDLSEHRAKVAEPVADQTASKPETVSIQAKDPPKDASGLIGTYLDGRYLVKRLIGEGGMGLVYEAEHVEIGRRVAVKVLHAAFTRQGEVVARFRAEARAATRIGHPHIIEVLDSGTTVDGAVYFVMEFLDGHDLADAIARDGSLPVSRTLAIAREICQALAAAHKAGIIHRDMKPENVFLISREGRGDFVKVLDFGIAKTLDGAQSERVGRLTNPGMAMGTPEYMAPEQAAGGPVDRRVDIYAMGAMLYEMLCGHPPHEGGNIMEILTRKATQAPVPLGRLRPDLPRELESLVMRMLASAPDARPQSMDELAQELGRLASGEAPTSPGVPAPVAQIATDRLPRSRAPYVVAGIAATILLVGGTGLLVQRIIGAHPRVPPAAVVVNRPAPPAPEPTAPPLPTEAQPAEPKSPPPRPSAPEQHAAQVISVRPVTVHQPGARHPAAPDRGKLLAEAGAKIAQARSLLQSGRFAEAQALFSEVEESGFQRGRAVTGQAEVAFQRGNYAQAVQLGRRAVEAGGGVPAQMVLGNSYFKLKKYDDAIAEYREVLRTDGSHTEAKYNLAAAEQKKGE